METNQLYKHITGMNAFTSRRSAATEVRTEPNACVARIARTLGRHRIDKESSGRAVLQVSVASLRIIEHGRMPCRICTWPRCSCFFTSASPSRSSSFSVSSKNPVQRIPIGTRSTLARIHIGHVTMTKIVCLYFCPMHVLHAQRGSRFTLIASMRSMGSIYDIRTRIQHRGFFFPPPMEMCVHK